MRVGDDATTTTASTSSTSNTGNVTSTATATPAPRPPRLTGRAALLLLIVAVLAVSYASSMRAYLHQREHIADLKAQIASSSGEIDALERQKKRWDDESYVEQEARKRFGYVLPGETSLQAIEGDGRPLDSGAGLADPDSAEPLTPQPWWDAAWRSVELAGDPPTKKDKPASVVPDDAADQ